MIQEEKFPTHSCCCVVEKNRDRLAIALKLHFIASEPEPLMVAVFLAQILRNNVILCAFTYCFLVGLIMKCSVVLP